LYYKISDNNCYYFVDIYMELRFEEPRQDHPSFIFQVPFRKIIKNKIGVVNI